MADSVVLTDGLPLLQSDGVTGRNSAHDIRKGLLATLLLPDVKSNPMAVRNGVIPHDWDTNGVKTLRVDQTSTASTSAVINPGPFICERAGQGPYIGWGETTSGYTITPNPADAANPRYDTIYAQVLDQAAISTDAQTNAIVGTLYGTASATPTVLADTALPDGAIRLADIYRPANDSNITAARITDRRKSTGLVGSTRILLPGDSISDPGKVNGEQRFRSASGSLPSLIDYWDAAQSVWRGTQGITYVGSYPGTPDQYQNVSGTLNYGTSNTIISLTIPDPGYPYRISASSMFKLSAVSGNATINYYVNVNNNQFAGCITTTGAIGICPLNPTGATVFTGSAVVRLKIDVLGTTGSVTWAADVRNYLTVQVNPA